MNLPDRMNDLTPDIYNTMDLWRERWRAEQEPNLGTDQHVPFELWAVNTLQRQHGKIEDARWDLDWALVKMGEHARRHPIFNELGPALAKTLKSLEEEHGRGKTEETGEETGQTQN